ncbi:MAG: glycoside hydrolase family 2, partial [Muribaculaceae bacterium]|nr:glycoside hydrolase family 2 [Muribaculaceae bacterium]
IVDAAVSEPIAGESVLFEIPELKLKAKLVTDSEGKVSGAFKVKKLTRWDTRNPKLYDVIFSTGTDTVSDQIGFRTIRTDGSTILLNGEPVFLAGVNIHEEIPQRKGRAFSEADAMMLLGEAKEMGVNFIRLAHYPQNEYIVKLAEKMGFLLWEEIPVWQNIDFANKETERKAMEMIKEMIGRDKNRSGIVIWSIANETHPSEARNSFLINLKNTVTELDDTRLVGAAFNNAYYNKEDKCFRISGDPCVDMLDVVGVNKYLGWYEDWQEAASDTAWDVAPDKPFIMSEFGCEALYGRHGEDDVKSSWSEDYQARVYNDNITMFENIPNLAGTSPWVLFDFRSPTRMSPQQGFEFNRKGLVSDRGERKKAWYLMRDYYKKKN